MGIMFQDQLLQQQECPLMRNLLSNLHHRLPSVLRRQLGTRRTLTCMHYEGEDESLLEDGMGEDFFLDGDFQFYTSGMGFGPDEGGVDQADFHEWSRDLLQAYRWGMLAEVFLGKEGWTDREARGIRVGHVAMSGEGRGTARILDKTSG
jgi:hypothetical protein